ncbi:Cytochrome P450 71A9 [Bienertia sinuspersici]
MVVERVLGDFQGDGMVGEWWGWSGFAGEQVGGSGEWFSMVLGGFVSVSWCFGGDDGGDGRRGRRWPEEGRQRVWKAGGGRRRGGVRGCEVALGFSWWCVLGGCVGCPIPIPMLNKQNTMIKSILIDGTDTSAATIVWAMTELIKNPNSMKKTQEEVRNLVKEQQSSNYIHTRTATTTPHIS